LILLEQEVQARVEPTTSEYWGVLVTTVLTPLPNLLSKRSIKNV